MTLLIAVLLIYGLNLHPVWYAPAIMIGLLVAWMELEGK